MLLLNSPYRFEYKKLILNRSIKPCMIGLLCVAILGTGAAIYASCNGIIQFPGASLKPELELIPPPQLLHTTLPLAVAENMYDPSSFPWRLWEGKFQTIPRSTPEEVLRAKEMLLSLHDRYSMCLSPQEAAEERERDKGNSFCTGFSYGYCRTETSGAKPIPIVLDVEDDSPAREAGLQPGDCIMSVNQIDIKGKTAEEMGQLFSTWHKTGQPMKLVVSRHGQQLELGEMKRRMLKFTAVRWKMLPAHVGYVRLYDFVQPDTVSQMEHALYNLAEADSIILDLRGNPGGLVANACGVAAFFMERGVVTKTKSRRSGDPNKPEWITSTISVKEDGVHYDGRDSRGHLVQLYRTPRAPYMLNHRPLVVLVNSRSASAAEMACGAIKDNGVGRVLGERTFGKGVGQSILDMADGTRIHITSLRYVSPCGHWPGDGLNRKIGISPNLEVKQPLDVVLCSNRDRQFRTAMSIARILSNQTRRGSLLKCAPKGGYQNTLQSGAVPFMLERPMKKDEKLY